MTTRSTTAGRGGAAPGAVGRLSPDQADAFDAFVSYSRKDATFVNQLVAALNSFKLPKLEGMPQRRLKVFRDESDLVGADYYESIEAYLKRARKLILVCSPRSAQSEFVNDEVKRFLELGDKQSIIPIIIDGKPNNEVSPGQVDEMAFPPALCEALEMPLAISYIGFNPRKEKVYTGAREGSWYSVIASILDISRDKLEERDKRRQRRRRRIILSIASAIIVALSALTFYAFDQKDIAERQRNEALATQSRFLADLATQQNAQGNFDLGMLLALEAAPREVKQATLDAARTYIGVDRPYVHEVAPALYDAVVHNRLRWTSDSKDVAERLVGSQSEVFPRKSPDGRWQVVLKGELVLEDLEGNVEPVRLGTGEGALFGPDSSWLIVTGGGERERLWALVGENAPREVPAITSVPHSDRDCPRVGRDQNLLMDWLPDGTRVSVCSDDGQNRRIARVWKAGSAQPLEIALDETLFTWARFSPDGRDVLTVSLELVRTRASMVEATTIRQWALDNAAAPVRWTRDIDADVSPLSEASEEELSLDGGWRLVADGEYENRVYRLIKVGLSEEQARFPPTGPIDSNGYRTVSWEDGAVEVEVKTGGDTVVASFRHQLPILRATLTRGGTRLLVVTGNMGGITASMNGYLWDVEREKLLAEFALDSLHGDLVGSLNGELFLVLPNNYSEPVLQVRATLDGAVIANLEHHNIADFRFSEDQRYVLILGFDDFDASVWRLFEPQALIELGCAMLLTRLNPDQRRQFFLPATSTPPICGREPAEHASQPEDTAASAKADSRSTSEPSSQ